MITQSLSGAWQMRDMQTRERLPATVPGGTYTDLYVELRLEGTNSIFSDNYFDLPACVTVQIHCPLPDGWTVEQARHALRVHSLADVVPAGSKASDARKHILLGLKPASLMTRSIFNFME